MNLKDFKHILPWTAPPLKKHYEAYDFESGTIIKDKKGNLYLVGDVMSNSYQGAWDWEDPIDIDKISHIKYLINIGN